MVRERHRQAREHHKPANVTMYSAALRALKRQIGILDRRAGSATREGHPLTLPSGRQWQRPSWRSWWGGSACPKRRCHARGGDPGGRGALRGSGHGVTFFQESDRQRRTMSLIVAMQVVGDDVVLAADRRGTYGDPRGLVCLDENMSKLYVYGHAALGIVGMPGAILDPVRAVQAGVAGAPDLVPPLSASLRSHYEKNFGLRPFLSNSQVLDARPQATVLYADRRPGAIGLCTLSSEYNFTPVPAGQRYVMAGVSNYALYLFQRLWRDSFSVDDGLRLGAFLITETSKLDPKVGPIPDLMVLRSDGAEQLDRSRVDEIMKGNDERIARFASSFQEKSNVGT
jgi:hypothetical protein